jgi:hypothetical protein
MANKYPNYSGAVRMQSIYRMSDAPPNWAQDDPTQPDYIANKDEAEKLRPISVDGELMLNDTHESGGLNFVSGKNVTLTTDGNSIIISAKNSGEGGGGDCDCAEIVEGEGIDIVENSKGQKVISLEPGAISDDYISHVSIEKIVQSEGTRIVLNGGNANG